MKSCKTIIGAAIIEIQKGTGLGEIHQVLVDENDHLIFIVKTKHSVQSFALLSGQSIHGIGDFAIMIEDSSDLRDIDEAELQELNDKQGTIFGEMVITIDGNKIGRVVDYHVDQKNEIGYLIVNPENASEEIQVPKSRILRIGKEYIILNSNENVASSVEEKTEPVQAVSKVAELEEKKNEASVVAKKPIEAADDQFQFDYAADKKEETANLVAEVTKATRDEELAEELSKASEQPAVAPVQPVEAVEIPEPKKEETIKAEVGTIEDMSDILQQLRQGVDNNKETNEVVETPAEPAKVETSIPEAPISLDAALKDIYSASSAPATHESAPVEKTPVEPVAIEKSKEEIAGPTLADVAEIQEEVLANVVPIKEGNVFLNQQKNLLVGKKLQKNLMSVDGNVILFAGDTVTNDTIDLLRRVDRKLLVRLAECVV